MAAPSAEVSTAQGLIDRLAVKVRESPALRQLDSSARDGLLRDLGSINLALSLGGRAPDPYAFALDDRPPVLPWTRTRPTDSAAPSQQPAPEPTATTTSSPRQAATETLAARAGALSDEIDFPAFVAGLIHGTFDAIVNASIRQMEAFADLVSAVAKDVDTFTRENVTSNQVRDWLAEKHPADLRVVLPPSPGAGQPRLERRQDANENEEQASPAWLGDYGLAGQDLTDELIEEQLVPAARQSVAQSRLQLLATMVLLGMNRINVRDGRISARVRFRAKAKDVAAVNYAVTSDPGGATWGDRGSDRYSNHTTMISTVGANVQAESDLKVELFGEVEINFVSETLPLERFADEAQMALMQRHTRAAANRPTAVSSIPASISAPANPIATVAAPPSGSNGPEGRG